MAAAQAASPAGTPAPAPAAPAPPPPLLHWLPPTLSAVALRLRTLDASLIYRTGRPPARDLLQADPAPARCSCCVRHSLVNALGSLRAQLGYVSSWICAYACAL